MLHSDAQRSPREALLLSFLAVLALVVLRSLQCRALGPLMYSNEFAQLGSLAADLASGRFDTGMSWQDFYRIYAYGDHAQGTLFMALAAVPFSWVFGPTTTALHAVTILCEATFVGLTGWMLAAHSRKAWALGAALFLFPPLFAAIFHLMPYGNHTEFLWLPVLLFLLATRGQGGFRVELLLALAASVAVLLYRLNLAGVLAAGAALLTVPLADRRRRAGALLLGIGLGFLLVGLVSGGEESTTSAYLPAFGFELGEVDNSLARLFTQTWPGVDRGGLQRVAALLGGLGMGIAGVVTIVRSDPDAGPLALFGLTWFGAAFVAPVVSGKPSPEYLLSAWYALGLTGLAGLAGTRGGPRLRALSVLSLALVMLPAVPSGLRAALGPEPEAPYDGVHLVRHLALQTLDPDDLRYWNTMAAGERSDKVAGLVTAIGPCARQIARKPGFVPRDLRASRCGRCSEEGIPEVLAAEVPRVDADLLPSLGAALWVRCNRDITEVERAVSALPLDTRDELVSGAEAEARSQAAASDPGG